MRNQKSKISCRCAWLQAIWIVLLLAVPSVAQSQQPAVAMAKSPTEQISDLVLFEDLQETAKRLYLPRYRLAVQTVSGETQYRVRFYKQGTGANLEVYLEKYPASELGDSARAAQELPHSTKVLLRYDLPLNSRGAHVNSYKELVFQEVTLERNGLKAVLHLDDLQERDALIKAADDSRLNAGLVVQRTFTVLSSPLKEIAGVQARIAEVDRGITWLDSLHQNCDPILTKWGSVFNGKEPMSSVPAKEQAGLVWCYQSMTPLVYKEPAMRQKRAPLEAELQRLRKQTGPVTVTLDHRQPFSFDRIRHPYVFSGVIPDRGAKLQLVREQVSWQGRYYSYFRTAERTDHWYYLPDRFVLAQEDRLPKLTVQFTGPQESQSVELEYAAVPYTDTARLESAKLALQSAVSSSVTVEPLVINEGVLWVALPGIRDDGPYHQRPGASVDLRYGLKDQVRLTLEEFQKIYAALFSASHTLLTGEVRLKPDGVSEERVPFEARVTELTPEAFWDKVISPLVFADYEKTIQVKTFASVFATEMKTLIVAFKECDDDVELFQNNLEAQVTLRLPMRDFILNTERGGDYHYKVTAIRDRNGKIQRTKMPAWKAATATILYPEVP
ncbi:MAG: hypothetical protein L0387_28880 [Acidobacteria bacterium]|nr:hypothetical protein [Acidobacteriota bacterium]